MTSAFAKKVRTHEIDEDIFKEVMKNFETDIALFDVVKIDEKIKSQAVELLKKIGIQRGLKTLDALQLSCVIAASDAGSVDLFIVSDKTLGEIAENLGLAVYMASDG